MAVWMRWWLRSPLSSQMTGERYTRCPSVNVLLVAMVGESHGVLRPGAGRMSRSDCFWKEMKILRFAELAG